MRKGVLVLLVAVVLVAGCSVAPAEEKEAAPVKAGEKPSTEKRAEPVAPARETPKPGPAPTPAAKPAARANEGGEASAGASAMGTAFVQLMEKNPGFRADYRVSSNLDGEDGSTAVTWVYQGNRKRIDTDVLSDLGIVSSKIFETGKETIICDTTIEWSCVSVEAGNVESEFDKLKKVAARIGDYEVIALPTKNLLGQKTQCFSVGDKEGAGTESYEVCLTQDGVPLYVHVLEVDAFGVLDTEFTATRNSQATGMDFELPTGTEVLAIE